MTNNGPLVQELELKIRNKLSLPHLWFTCNGTVVLQMAIKALQLKGEIITTPFSYVATLNALIWEGCEPVFADIEPRGFGLDPAKVEAAITPRTSAILATLVYGLPGEIEALEALAAKYNLKLILDGAHAFGVAFKGRSLLSYGDVATTSFHATKVFHTIEGGALITKDNILAGKLRLMRQFGHHGDDYHSAGINAKNSELHAAVGLSMLPHFDQLVQQRKAVYRLYAEILGDRLANQEAVEANEFIYNYSYCPVLLSSDHQVTECMLELKLNDINARRYFWPSLNLMPYVSYQACPVAEDISSRILCLPLYPGLSAEDTERIAEIVLKHL